MFLPAEAEVLTATALGKSTAESADGQDERMSFQYCSDAEKCFERDIYSSTAAFDSSFVSFSATAYQNAKEDIYLKG
jgi:hypothetical protein